MRIHFIVAALIGVSVAGCDAPADPASPPAPSTDEVAVTPSADEVAATSQEAAIAGIEAQLAQMLQCASRPEPTPLLIALAEAGRIDVERNIGFDGVSCFALEQPILLPARGDAGPLPVETLCAFDETYPETLAGTPYEGRMYERGPGTSPGMVIQAVVRQTNSGAAYSWLQANDARLGARIEPWTVVSEDPALVAITCSRLE